jgi:hypothetical protein
LYTAINVSKEPAASIFQERWRHLVLVTIYQTTQHHISEYNNLKEVLNFEGCGRNNRGTSTLAGHDVVHGLDAEKVPETCEDAPRENFQSDPLLLFCLLSSSLFSSFLRRPKCFILKILRASVVLESYFIFCMLWATFS